MRQYEYKTLDLKDIGEEPLEDVLNRHGKDGWKFKGLYLLQLVFERITWQ